MEKGEEVTKGVKPICVIDYGVGNLGSLKSLLDRERIAYIITSSRENLIDAQTILLSGVGSFDFGMKNLESLGLTEILREKVSLQSGKLVGVCLGMQLLFESSEEGELPGLGIVSGEVKHFRFGVSQPLLKTPHMGWSQIKKTSYASGISDQYDKHRFYFVHSYYAAPSDDSIVKYRAFHGHEFPAVIESGNVIASQFHPEKSSLQGRAMLLEMLGHADEG